MTQLLQVPPELAPAAAASAANAHDDNTTAHACCRRVAFLTNEIPPYRVPLYHELAKTPGWDFRVFTCVEREFDRLWDIRQSFPFWTKKSFSLSYIRRLKHHGRENFDESRQIHLPLGHFWDLCRFAPDIVISAELGARTAIGAIYARLLRKRLIVYYEGTLHTDRDLSKKQRAVRRLIRRAPHAYLVNGRQGRDYLESVSIPSQAIFEIGEAVDTEAFERRPSADERAAFREKLGIHGECYLFCGTLKPRKGVDYLLKAWASFLQAIDGDATLVIVGEGPERGRFEQFTRDAGLSNVRFLGHLQRDRLPAIYYAADVFVFPSLEDCWALVVNEAMVAGLPVINSKYAGSADLITDSVNGWVIDPLNEADLVRGLRAAWDSRFERGRMSDSVRATIAEMAVPKVADRIRRAVQTVDMKPGTRLAAG